ncbi:pyridoxal phosphate-dependent aminotransferase [Spelaeicoccus albus]|uniref:Aminotransferase n=1 Tax=Spelaeicoccus albus TaxID=1280376 RepID=A0A7Z0IIS2_9MICO|nr:pyridoxal phosphate-dependent aminotransferase [Spelaeicoccus albus]NYI68795.1 aspartate aminotransferase [Spelaeicoccus albus]
MTMHSATLAMNEAMEARRAAGENVLHLGFGEAGLPVPESVAKVLATAAPLNSYGSVAGSNEARSAAAGWFSRRGHETEASQIIFAPGSKALLFGLLSVLDGDLVLPCPSWVSYAAQADLVGKAVINVPIPQESGGIPDPALLEAALESAIRDGRKPGAILLTIPDNPTGTVADAGHVEAICRTAAKYDLAIISDEIYAELSYDSAAPTPLSVAPDRTIVTSGLSKSMALGGWRIGFARVPKTDWGSELMQQLIGVGSEIWSSLAAPMQAVAAHVLSEPLDVTEHIRRARFLHSTVGNAVYAEFIGAGALCRRPTAGFYLYPDFEPVRPRLAVKGIQTGPQLVQRLLDCYGVGVLDGTAFGDDESNLRARVATSLLYGSTIDERWRSLHSDDPIELPWIAKELAYLHGSLRDLVRGTNEA